MNESKNVQYTKTKNKKQHKKNKIKRKRAPSFKFELPGDEIQKTSLLANLQKNKKNKGE